MLMNQFNFICNPNPIEFDTIHSGVSETFIVSILSELVYRREIGFVLGICLHDIFSFEV